ncbi:MAG TPA: YlbF family regulator [Vicinamibacterales bacterium]|nr:YlbF family regulator [Vicinamibacterales bacterium]
MDQLIQKAEELGRLLSEHERFKGLIAARDVVRADPKAAQLLRDYDALVRKVQHLAETGQPIGVDDKHKLADMEKLLSGNAAIRDFAAAQADFTEMMNHVNRAIYAKLGPEALEDEDGLEEA